jgi:hypothetical protein
MITDERGALTLHFVDHARVAGEALHGQVDLDFVKAREQGIQQVRVKLRGSVQSYVHDIACSKMRLTFLCRRIRRNTGNSSVTYREIIPLVREDTVLWTQGGTYPSPGTHVLELPFVFVLPRTLPPSFHCARNQVSASVSYSIEVVGDRPGLFRFNRRLGLVFPVVPRASREQVDTRLRLNAGWDGPWREAIAQDNVRPHPWGSYGHIMATLELPTLQSYPICTPIPFRLRVTTRTKPVERSDAPVEKGKPLFPAPPRDAAGVELRLDSVAYVEARRRGSSIETTVLAALGGLGSAAPRAAREAVSVTVDEPVWIPVEGASGKSSGKGTWNRNVTFSSSFVLACPPTVQTPILSCNVCFSASQVLL